MFLTSRRTLTLALLVAISALAWSGIAWADSFYDGFDTSPDPNWRDMPAWADISGGTLKLNPPLQGDQCWITSLATFTYGTCTIRFKTTVDHQNFVYMGYTSRDPWYNPAANVRLDGGAWSLGVAGGAVGGDGNALRSPTVTPNEWHTLSIVRRPDGVIFIYDDEYVGTYQGAWVDGVYKNYVPTTELPIIIDTTRSLATPLNLEIDYVSVTDSTDVNLPYLFLDTFDNASDTQFRDWPGWQSISNGELTLHPPLKGDWCWTTSNKVFQYGTYTAKFDTTDEAGNFLYIGSASRSPWMNPAAYTRMDWNLNYGVGNGAGGVGGALTNYAVTPGWHTMSIIRKPDAVEYYYDGANVGTITSNVPTHALPLIMDVGQNGDPPMTVKFDYISVTPGTSKPDFVDMFDDYPDNWWQIDSPAATSHSNGVIRFAPPFPFGECHATSHYLWQYGTFTAKFKLNVPAGGFAFLGGFSRDPWSNPACYARYENNGSFWLLTGKGPGQIATTLVKTPIVTPDEWHTLTIIRRPGSVSMLYDGLGCGTTTENVPDQLLPLAIDVTRAEAESYIEVDEVTVTSDMGATSPVVSMNDAKTKPNGTPVTVNGGIVTWKLDNLFYMEKEDRSSGIRVVKTAHGFAVGAKVNVSGYVLTDEGIAERYIDAYDATSVGTGSVAPVAMNNKVAGGAAYGTPPSGQPGMTGGVGLNNVGLLVRVYGEVSVAADSTVSIDDGSGVNLWVLPITGTLTANIYIGATGIMSSIVDGTTVRPYLLIHNVATDVTTY